MIYFIAVAGSLLGVALPNGVSFPVGKVNSLYLYPMNFYEFVRAVKSEKYDIERAVKYSLLPRKSNDVVQNIPLYLVGLL